MWTNGTTLKIQVIFSSVGPGGQTNRHPNIVLLKDRVESGRQFNARRIRLPFLIIVEQITQNILENNPHIENKICIELGVKLKKGICSAAFRDDLRINKLFQSKFF